MKKIFYFLTLFALVVGLIGFIFNLSEYDFFTQLELASNLPFNNPIDCLKTSIENIKNVPLQTSVSWWENLLFNPFIKTMLMYIYNIIVALVEFLICILNDIYYGLQLVLIMLGFTI